MTKQLLITVPMDEEYFENSRHQKLREWSLPAKEDKAVMIILHGFGDHIMSYTSVAGALQDQYNVRVCGYDHVGHGKSDGPRADIPDFNHYVDDAFEYIKHIQSKIGQLPLFILGYSMGGLILGHMLSRDKDICKGAIFYSPAIHINTAEVTPFKVALVNVVSYILPSLQVGSSNDDLVTRNKAERERMEGDSLRYKGRMKARMANNMLKYMQSFQSKRQEITTPLLIVHGDSDKICLIEGSKKLYEECQSTDKELKVFEGCYHRLHTEPDGVPERLISDIGKWINERC